MIVGKAVRTILPASFRRHFSSDSWSWDQPTVSILSLGTQFLRQKNAYNNRWDKYLQGDIRPENPCVGGSGLFYEFQYADMISFCFLKAGSLGSYERQLGLSKFVPVLCQCRSQNSSGTSSRPV